MEGATPKPGAANEKAPRTPCEFFAFENLTEPCASARAFLYLFVVGLVIAYLLPYMPLEEQMNRAVARMLAPALDFSYPRSGRDLVTIVQIDDDDLAEYKETWPLSYGFHRRRLREIARLGASPEKRPKAIFIDVLFLDERKEDTRGLKNAFCEIAAAGVHVYLASLKGAGREYPRTAELAAASQNGKPCVTEVSVARKDDAFDQSAWEYRLVTDGNGKRPGMNAAALAIFQSMRPDEAQKLAVNTPLALIWGATPHPFNLSWMRSARTDEPLCTDSWKERLFANVLWILAGFNPFADVEAAKPLCPYSRVLPLRAMQGGRMPESALDGAFGGRAVIYGMNLQSSGDLVHSPLHGHLPGPYLHAMALDNLISFNPRPKRHEKFAPGKLRSRGTLFTFVALAALAAAMVAGAHFRARREKRVIDWWVERVYSFHRPRIEVRTYAALKRRFFFSVHAYRTVRALLSLLLYALIAAAIATIGYEWFDLGPLTWMKYAAFMLLAHFIHVAPRIERAVSALLSPPGHETEDSLKEEAKSSLSPEKRGAPH